MTIHKQTLSTVMTATATGDEPCIVISTGAVDRQLDEIVPGGGDFRAYLKNPVVLFGHDHHALPVGVTTSLHVTNGGVQAKWRWLENNARAAAVRNAFDQGALRAASIGFVPRESVRNGRGGLRFTEWELVEWSLCAVPANGEAVRVLRSLGLQSETERVEVLDVTGFSENELVRLAAGTNRHRSEPFGDPYRRDHEITDVSREDLRTSVQGVVRVALAAAVRAETAKALNRARGRVD
jgi:HK97 family phage prohead protease